MATPPSSVLVPGHISGVVQVWILVGVSTVLIGVIAIGVPLFIKYCRQRGVNMDLFPPSSFSGGELEQERSTECPICLSEFQEGEQVITLPLCSHVYHPDCIGPWFRRHSMCPACRHDYSGYTLGGDA